MIRLALALAFTLITSCTFGPSGAPGGAGDDDPLTVDGISTEAVDVGGDDTQPPERGRLNAPCRPTGDDCAETYTCRLRTADTGLCRPIAGGAPGDACVVDDDCGADMTCIEPDGVCAVVCSVAAPSARCGALLCIPLWETVGVCELPGE